MAEIIDLALLKTSRQLLHRVLDTKGLNYFLRHEASRPFQLEPSRVELVVRTAAKMARRTHALHQKTLEHARSEVRKELIRRVVSEMLQLGL